MKENLTTISAYQSDNSYLKAKQEFETLRAEERENVLGLIAYFCKEFDITLSELNRAISTSSVVAPSLTPECYNIYSPNPPVKRFSGFYYLKK